MVTRLMKTLDGKKVQLHPNCLYLSWTEEGPTPRYHATWCSYRDIDLSKSKFSVYVKWKDYNMDVMIATDYVGSAYTVDMENTCRNKEYLKSHLQKAIRRSNAPRALKTAWHFLDLDLHDFLRRLAIIAVEDCLPLDGYANIVWFMAAVSKGYIPSDEQICWILGYVYDLAQCGHYEQIDHDDKLTVKNVRARSLSQEGKNLVYSIMLRKAYGGMKGDKAMCMSAAKSWSARYLSNSAYLKLLVRENIFITPPICPMQKSEWIVGAIDFHCCPNIVTAMWEKHDEFTEEEIQSAIWHCSSSITDKELLGGKDGDLGHRNPGMHETTWKAIRKDFLGYARFMLDRNS